VISTPIERWRRCDPRRLRTPVALIFNPRAGHKLGVETNAGGGQDVQAALQAEGIQFEAWPTEHAGHATELALRAVSEGREVVVAAGGDGTVNEVAQGLAGSDTVLGLMPLGSVMNVAGTLWAIEAQARRIRHVGADLDEGWAPLGVLKSRGSSA